MLDLVESFEYLKKLPIQDFIIINSETDLKKAEEKFSFPIFLKVSLAEHKLKIGGVKKANNYEELLNNYKLMNKNFPDKKIIAQKSMKGIEMIMGIKEDRIFGKLLLIGAGGIDVEKAKDISFRAFPLTKEEIIKMINGLKISKNLSEKFKEKLIEVIEKIIHSVDVNNIKEIDINPLMVNEKEAKIIDARVDLA